MATEIIGTDITAGQLRGFYGFADQGYIIKSIFRKFLKGRKAELFSRKPKEFEAIDNRQIKAFWDKVSKKEITRKSFQGFLNAVHSARSKNQILA